MVVYFLFSCQSAAMTTRNTPSGKPYDDLLFCITYAISRASSTPKPLRTMDAAESVAKAVVEHLARCNYVVSKGPDVRPHGSFMPET